MATNPIPDRISPAMWRLWEEFHAYEPQAGLGGIFANKKGYHNYRANLPSSDYSVEDIARDRQGPSNWASAWDIGLNEADMIRYTKRLDVAARNNDPRLWLNGTTPILREFIGTKDGNTVYCYVLCGGVPLGVGADRGSDPGRDESHLWHIHISLIRLYCNNWEVIRGILSVLKGETIEQWRGDVPLEGNDKTFIQDAVRALLVDEDDAVAVKLRARSVQYKGGGLPSNLGPNAIFLNYFTDLYNTVKALQATIGTLVTAVSGLDDVDEDALGQAVAVGIAPLVTAAILAALPDDTVLTEEELTVATEQAVRNVLGGLNDPA